MKRENDLGRDDVGALVWRTALPSMLAQFVSVLYSIVDRMYIGHIAGAGRNGAGGRGRLRAGGDHGRLGGGVDIVGRVPADGYPHGRRQAGGGKAHSADGLCHAAGVFAGDDGAGHPAARTHAAIFRRERRDDIPTPTPISPRI